MANPGSTLPRLEEEDGNRGLQQGASTVLEALSVICQSAAVVGEEYEGSVFVEAFCEGLEGDGQLGGDESAEVAER